MIVRVKGHDSQIYDTVEGVNPGTRIRNRDSVHFGTVKFETAGVMGGRVGGILEGFHPRFEGGSAGLVEADMVEKMSSSPWNPRLGDETTRPERSRFIVQMVRDEVENLWWEGGRHRGIWSERWVPSSHGPPCRDRSQHFVCFTRSTLLRFQLS